MLNIQQLPRYKKMKLKKKSKNGRFMKIALAIIILQVIVYTWIHLFLSFKCQMEIAPTTTIGFYSFCGFEAGVCGYIKKIKHTSNSDK